MVPSEEYTEEEPEDDIQEVVEAENLEDLESYPSGSMNAIGESSENFDLKVDQITDELLAQILNDFEQDPTVRMEVEDIDDAPFEEMWPWSLDKKVEEPE